MMSDFDWNVADKKESRCSLGMVRWSDFELDGDPDGNVRILLAWIIRERVVVYPHLQDGLCQQDLYGKDPYSTAFQPPLPISPKRGMPSANREPLPPISMLVVK